MIKMSRPAWEQQAEAEAQDERSWGARRRQTHRSSSWPCAVTARASRPWHVRLLGRAVARRLPGLRVSLACVDRDLPSLPR